MSNEFQPVLSRMQMRPDQAPKDFAPSPTCPHSLSRISCNFTFAHHDLCLFHQALYFQLREREKAVEEYANEMRPHFERHNREVPEDDEDGAHEWEAVQLSRVRETMNVHWMETTSIQAYGDQLLIIACWAMVEQYAGRILIALEQELGSPANRVETPHRWHELIKRFKSVGLDITQCENFKGIDECRVVNNKIKHVGFIDKELAKIAAFQGCAGKRFEDVKLPLQSYVDAVYEFVGSAMEKAGDVLLARGIDYQTSKLRS